MKYRLAKRNNKEPASTNVNNQPQQHQDNQNPQLQTVLAAILTALRPYPDALPAVESVLAKLLGNNPTTNFPTGHVSP